MRVEAEALATQAARRSLARQVAGAVIDVTCPGHCKPGTSHSSSVRSKQSSLQQSKGGRRASSPTRCGPSQSLLGAMLGHQLLAELPQPPPERCVVACHAGGVLVAVREVLTAGHAPCGRGVDLAFDVVGSAGGGLGSQAATRAVQEQAGG
jgi:hypothetical protein